MAETSIEWADTVWNPTTGCDRVSPGCDNCYALTLAKRLKGMGSAKYQRDGDPRTSGPGFGVSIHADALDLPLRWRKPRRIFVNSMSDLFHDDIPDSFIVKVFDVMGNADWHTFQLLTKRHARMRSFVTKYVAGGFGDPERPGCGPLRNVQLGVSVEDQKWADIRIPALLETPAAVRWLSMEPLLGPVNLAHIQGLTYPSTSRGRGVGGQMFTAGPGIDWVVVGGESGPGARLMELRWAQSLVDQCYAAYVPVFVKQLGSRWGKNHHDIDAFPDALRIREYPQAVSAHG